MTKINDDAIIILNSSKGAKEVNSWHLFCILIGMKILIVSQHYYPDPFSITTIAEYLVKKGHDVTVLTGKPNYGYYRIVPGYEHLDYEILNGVKIYRVNVILRKGTKMSIVKNYLSFWKNAKRKVNKL